MHRIHCITRKPDPAQSNTGDKFPFAEDLLGILIPLFTHKNPQNPVPEN